MTRIIFVRHGQTLWNQELKYQGHTDIALTDQGIRQADLAAKRLSREQIAAVYSSDLSRAFLTAERIAAQFGLPVASFAQLREFRFGDWEGLTYDQIQKRWPDEAEQFVHSPGHVQIPGGETYSEVQERMEQLVLELVKKHDGQTIVIVSHGAAIRAVLCAALHMPLDYVGAIRQDNTAVNIVEYYGEQAIVTLVNDIHHLDETE